METLNGTKKTHKFSIGKGNLKRPMKMEEIVVANSIKNPTTQCWEWTGFIQSNGYGKTMYNQKSMYAHRLAYLAFKGAIPLNNDVCHVCDNRKCVNPDHLFTGTRKQNMQDAVRKDRQAKGAKLSILHCGEKSTLAKLTWDQVRDIRASPESAKALAAIYHVHSSNIHYIRRNITWRE